MITETEDVARALDDAARRWPEDAHDRARLVRRLLEEGHRSVVEDELALLVARRKVVQETAGMFTGLYEPDHLAKLREDWPE